MTHLSEDHVERHAIDILQDLGYAYLHGADLAPEGAAPERDSFATVVLERRLRAAIARNSADLLAGQQNDAVRAVLNAQQPDLIAGNQAFHRMLTEGITVSKTVGGEQRGDLALLIDWAHPERNDFLVVNQFSVIEDGKRKRPDVLLFVNGLPLVILEFKNPVNEETTVTSAFDQLETYRQAIPSLFVYNAINVVSVGVLAKAGSLSAGFSRYMSWRSLDGETVTAPGVDELETLLRGMLHPAVLLDLVRSFIVFVQTKKETADGLIQVTTVKKLAAYHQYYAVNKAVASTLRATGFDDSRITAQVTGSGASPVATAGTAFAKTSTLPNTTDPASAKTDPASAKTDAPHDSTATPQANDTAGQSRQGPSPPQANPNLVSENPTHYGLATVTAQAPHDRKAGVVWHTQGSGKSLSMVFYAGKIIRVLDNPTLVLITDRNDLDDQLFDTFASAKQLLRQEPVQALDRTHLRNLLNVTAGGVVFTTIHKFSPESGNEHAVLTDRTNVIVIADEAHRTQYGFAGKERAVRDAEGVEVGVETTYVFAKYLRDALPNATYLGFTGTPVEGDDRNTPAVFGNYVDVYDIAQAVADGATVPIYYESRLARVALSDEGKALVDDMDAELDLLEEDDRKTAKWAQLEALVGSSKRLQIIAADLVAHFGERQGVNVGKGMIVAMSRRIAADLFDAIIALRPEWHDADLNRGRIKVVMTAASSEGAKIGRHHTTKSDRRKLAERMKDPADELELVIVCAMWLTGFDAPSLHTIYIDKPMQGHNLAQAITRVNRVYKNKPGGLIVDYLGIASDLKRALKFYSDAGGKGDPAQAQDKAVPLMLEKLDVLSGMMHGFAYEEYFDADTGRKLRLLQLALDHVLGLDDGKKRFLRETTALSKVFAIAIPHEAALDAKDEVAFFQAVKSRLVKLDPVAQGKTREELDTAVKQVIDQALVSDEVVDVFDAAGIKKPNISILSEEFLAELKNMEQKNLALEVLRKLLNDEITVRSKVNLVKSRSLREALEAVIKRYQNKILTAAEVIQELIDLSKEIVASDAEASAMKLTAYEYAFYTAVASNDSARQILEQDKLRELAVVLFEEVRQSSTIDWTVRESARAKLRVVVKRILRRFGYPPDMQKLATDTVLAQAERLVREMTR